MPVFFGLAGFSADLTVLGDPTLLLLTGALILIASIGKFGGAFVGGTLGGLSGRESMALASGMNARGSTEVIIATIGLSIGVLSQNLYTMIVTMAIVTTMAMPPMLRATLARVPTRQGGKGTARTGGTEEKGFVSNLERILLAVDESINAKFAATIAGLMAGTRGLPITVLHIGAQARSQEKNKGDEEVRRIPSATPPRQSLSSTRKMPPAMSTSQPGAGARGLRTRWQRRRARDSICSSSEWTRSPTPRAATTKRSRRYERV